MGNRVKGRVKKKSIKAALNSNVGSVRKLSRMGKRQKKDHAGLDATFIGRSVCLKRLQVTLKDFRRLCILKGVYPREPRGGRAPRNKKGQVFYHLRDLKSLSHEPLLEQFREFKAFMKKVRRAAGRNDKDQAARMEARAPTYTLHRLVRERYPRFEDALGDLDDALSLAYLFSALPSARRIKTKVTLAAQRLTASWGAYVATASALTRVFVSVKGVYCEARVIAACGSATGGAKPVTVRWIVPHAFTQHLPDDVDYRVMLTFFEFYEVLLGFVLFRLYADLGVRYPLASKDLEEEKEGAQAAADNPTVAHLRALHKVLRRPTVRSAVTEAVVAAVGSETDTVMKDATTSDKTEGAPVKSKQGRKQASMQRKVNAALQGLENDGDGDHDGVGDVEMEDDDDDTGGVDVSEPLRAALDTIGSGGPEDQNASLDTVLTTEALGRRVLFRGFVFYFSREVPRGYLELAAVSHGARVVDNPADPCLTHWILDRPSSPDQNTSSTYETVQPQWVLDCVNHRLLLPCGRYLPGQSLPPHLSPWVDHDDGYTPDYAKEIERIRNGEADEEEVEVDNENNSKANQNDTQQSAEDTNDKGLTAEKENQTIEDDDDDEAEEEEENEEVVKTKREKAKEKEDAETHALAKLMMSKKAARLYGKMQHGLKEKRDRVAELERRRALAANSVADDNGDSDDEEKAVRKRGKARTPVNASKEKSASVDRQKQLRLKEERKQIAQTYGSAENRAAHKNRNKKRKTKS